MKVPEKWPEQKPVSVPLPCYGMSYVATHPACMGCAHQDGCAYWMGSRATKIPLGKAEFQLIPKAYGQHYCDQIIDDPEIPNMQRLYKDCYETVYGKPCASTDRVQPFAKEIIDGARRAECSLRLWYLANMVGHRAHQQTIISHLDRKQPARFQAKLLVGKLAERRVSMYAELCRKDFGTFSIGALGALDGEDIESNSAEYRMFTSEMAVGHFIVDWKISKGGPPFEDLYINKELSIDPLWLATEPTYAQLVLIPWREDRRGSEALKAHRFSVSQTIGYLKKHPDSAILAFRHRESAVRRAVPEVLRLFGFSVDDFEIENEPVTDTLKFWSSLARSIQHYHCIQCYEKKHSIFTR